MGLKVANVYAEGEGYITFLLLKSLAGDGTLPHCFKYVDRLIFLPAEINLLLIPEINQSEEDILKNHPHRDKLTVISKNCKGLENCLETPAELPYFYGALLKVAEVLKEDKLTGLLKETELVEPEEDEHFQKLLEKLLFYIPVLIGKRESVIYAWKYFLGKEKHPAITHIYPRDGEVIPRIFSNILFTDKIIPVPLGVLPGGIIEEIKLKGFVPYGVKVEGKNNLDSELKLINYGRKLAKKLRENRL